MASTATTKAVRREAWEVDLDGIESDLAKLHDRVRAFREKFGRGHSTATIMRAWAENWKKRHGADYEFDRRKDSGQLKRLLGSLGYDELANRLRRYLLSNDPFVVKNRHPLNLFYSSVNRYAGGEDRGAAEALAPPVDCKHQPPCRDDVEHTRRRIREARTSE